MVSSSELLSDFSDSNSISFAEPLLNTRESESLEVHNAYVVLVTLSIAVMLAVVMVRFFCTLFIEKI